MTISTTTLLVFALFELGTFCFGTIYESAEKKLLDDLLFPEHKQSSSVEIFDLNSLTANDTIQPNVRFIYNKYARPTPHPHKPLDVTVSVAGLRLARVDEKQQTIYVDVVLSMKWHDYQLQWDPSNYSQIESIYVPIDRIWIPDIDVVNKAGAADAYMDGKMARVNHNGQVVWSPHYFYKVHCTLDMRKFPYDTQTCALLLSSWTYDVSKVHFKFPDHHFTFVLNDRVTRKEWHVRALPDHASRFQLPCCPEHYDLLVFMMTMTRDSLYHRYVLFLPGVLLCFLTIFVLLLPPECGEKISLGIGIVIGLILMILVLDDFLPTDMASIPLIVKYYGFALVLTVTYIALSSWVLNMYHRDPKGGKIPIWLRKIISCRCFRLCLSRDMYARLTEDPDIERFVFRGDDNLRQLEDLRPIADNAAPMAVSPGSESTTDRLLEEIRADLKSCVSTLQRSGSRKQSQWFYVAMALNRIASCIYIIGTIAITCIILAP